MIVQTSIDESGAVSVAVDSDGDVDGYSTDIIDDLANRSTTAALTVWRSIHEASDEHTDA